MDNSRDKIQKNLVDIANIYDVKTGSKDEDDKYDVMAHNLFGIHIKEKNDALSDSNPHICIGWSELGDLSFVVAKEELAAIYDQHYENNARGKGQDVGQIWRFKEKVNKGDYVVFADGKFCHIGRVDSDYYFDKDERDSQDPDYKNCRKVTWLKKNIARDSLSKALNNSLCAAMSFWSMNDYRAAIYDLLNDTYTIDDDVINKEKIDPDEQKQLFKEWLEKQLKEDGSHYSDNTIYQYVHQIEKGYNAFNAYKGYPSVYSIQSTEELMEYTAYLFNAEGYKEFNDKNGSRPCTYGLIKYGEFLEESESPENPDDNDEPKATTTCLDIKREPKGKTEYPLNFILYGAPGTGKTYSTATYAMAIIEETNIEAIEKKYHNRKLLMEAYKSCVQGGKIVFTTFHQSYGYEEFIQGLRPDTKEKGLSFDVVDGTFKKIADNAISGKSNFVIIIDEINRGNISKIFGELITLIEEDKRWGEINEMSAVLPSGEPFTVPNNLYIIGTMNSADKSISLIDVALRRRFDFIEQKPDSTLIKDEKLRKVFEALNEKLVDDLGSTDLLIGHSYFIDKTEDDLIRIMNNNIIPLLYEYYYDDRKKVSKTLTEALKNTSIVINDDKVGRLSVKQK